MIKCVAIDDEPIALSIIQEYCNRMGGIELHTFTSPSAGMKWIREHRPDIVFLDIEMKSHNGIDLARQLPEGIALVFTTAFAQYAIDGFEADAIDFLHKPIFYPRLERAMQKALKWLGTSVTETNEAITLKVGHKNIVIRLADISYIEAMDNYVRIFRKNSPTIMPQITMKEMEQRLASGAFMRIHRSYIVPLNDIERFSNRQIYLKGLDNPIPVGRKYTASLVNFYNSTKPNQSEK